MPEIITISNNTLTVTISTKGAEIKSIKKNGKEIIWEGDPSVWSGQTPILFPICGGLKDDKFIYGGKEYTLEKHGYARISEFEIEKADKSSAVFLLKSNEESLKKYPFEYEFRVFFTLDENTLKVDYTAKNTGDKTMYYAAGAHEAYACANGIEEWSVIFEKDEEFKRTVLNGNLLELTPVPFAENGKELPLKNEYFETDAIVLENIKSRRVTLKNRNTKENIDVEFEGNDYLLIWTKPGANYICIEPWGALPDFVDSDNRLEHKKGITALAKGEEHTNSHKIIL